MKLNELIKNGANVTLNVSAQDLRDFFYEIADSIAKTHLRSTNLEPVYLSRKETCQYLQIDPSTL